MLSSLDALDKNLTKELCKNVGKNTEDDNWDLLLRKRLNPYGYVGSLEKLNETQSPPRRAFYSRLNGTVISEEDYDHAQTVWKEFKSKTLHDYNDLYNFSDVFSWLMYLKILETRACGIKGLIRLNISLYQVWIGTLL